MLYLLVGATHFLLPVAQLRGGRGITEEFFSSLAGHSLVFSVHYGLVVLLSVLSIAVILAFFKIVSSANKGIALWVTVIGIIGAALSMVDFASVGVNAPRMARHFGSYTESEKLAASVAGLPHVDPCFLSWGLLGIWAFACSWLALKNRRLPKNLCLVGILGGSLYIFVFLGSILQEQLVVDIAVGAGGLIAAPIWYIWFGLALKNIYGCKNSAG